MMILPVEQGSPAWTRARLGIPTCSSYDKIITAKTRKPSSSAGPYMNSLLAEWITGYPTDSGSSGFTERGTRMESEARNFYGIDNEVEQVGFVMREDEMTGGSPDGLVGERGGVDFKCPALHTMIGYLMNPASLAEAYQSQVQGYMYLTGRDWWDLCAYSPDLPAVIVRVDRDEEYIDALHVALDAFVARLIQGREFLNNIPAVRDLRAARLAYEKEQAA